MAGDGANREKFGGIIAVRWIVSIAFPGALIIGAPPEAFVEVAVRVGGIALFLLAANAVWWLSLRRYLFSLENLALVQPLYDLAALAFGLHLYGSASGPAGFLFVLVVLEAGILLPRRGSVLVAGAASIAYALLLLLEAQGLGNPLFPSTLSAGLLPAEANLVIQALVKILFFYVVAYLAADFTEAFDAAHRRTVEALAAAQAAERSARAAEDDARTAQRAAEQSAGEARAALDRAREASKEATFMAEFNKAIIENIPIGVIVLAADTQILVYNAAMMRITEIPPIDALNRRLDDVFPGLSREWEDPLRRVQETGEEIHLLGVKVPLRDGNYVPANVRILPLKTGDAVLGVVLAFQTSKR